MFKPVFDPLDRPTGQPGADTQHHNVGEDCEF